MLEEAQQGPGKWQNTQRKPPQPMKLKKMRAEKKPIKTTRLTKQNKKEQQVEGHLVGAKREKNQEKHTNGKKIMTIVT